jgi:hypothetical protein
MLVSDIETKFLPQFAQRRDDRRFTCVTAAARQRPLPAMGTQVSGAQGEQQRRFVGLIGIGQRDRDRRALEPGCGLIGRQTREGGATRGDIPSRGIA